MAEGQISSTISFKNVQIFKEETLGIGSYGKVCRARCDLLPCAAKIIHETLFDPTAEQQMPRGKEHRLPIRRFEQECEFLNTIRHPNVIQYLGMYRDPDTGLPVLLMELMDESLTHFLEASCQPIPYHIQVNICHDIAMALTFLHANGIVHRDLSSNNVLLISNVRAKVTDFGMAKLDGFNPGASRHSFTMCPGADVYMPPEAVQDQPVYSEKIDCFAFGVIVVQMLTRQFPKPGDRMQRLEVNHPRLPRGTLMVCIPEVDRRQNHISQVDPNHSLLPISLDCLKDRDVERPSAQQICERIASLKEQELYVDSTSVAQTRERDLEAQIRSLTLQVSSQLQEKNATISSKDRDICLLLEQNSNHVKELEEKTNEIASRDTEIQQLREQLRLSISMHNSAGPDMKLKWRMGTETAPQAMYRWCNAVAGKTVAYFNANGDTRIYRYDVANAVWSCLPNCPFVCSSLALIGETLTAVGGIMLQQYSNKIHSLKQNTQLIPQWVEEFPPMPTKRHSATTVCTRTALIVAGGESDREVANVEAMNLDTQQWSAVECLPKAVERASGVICEDRLYIVGGADSNSCFSCSLSDLLRTCHPISHHSTSDTAAVWSRLADLPTEISHGTTCVSLCARLLAIGGSYSKAVFLYNAATNTWERIGEMLVSRLNSFAVTFPTNTVMVVGGWSGEKYANTVEFADLM